MPVENGVGYSSSTITKERHFNEVAATLLQSVAQCEHPSGKNFLFIDLNAGPGILPDRIFGSPLIFCALAAQYPDLFKRALFFEVNRKNSAELSQWVSDYQKLSDFRIEIFQEDHNDGLRREIASIPWQQTGLIYNDPSGTMPSFSSLREVARSLPYVDILINCPATTCKRLRGAGFAEKRLDQHIAEIPKKTWLVREPWGAHQWTFLLGTNRNIYSRFEYLGFHESTSRIGAKILRKLAFTALELENVEERLTAKTVGGQIWRKEEQCNLNL